MSVELVIRLVAMLLAALATGGLMVNWFGLARAMARVSSASAYTEFHQATNRTFEPYMPIVVFGAFSAASRSRWFLRPMCAPISSSLAGRFSPRQTIGGPFVRAGLGITSCAPWHRSRASFVASCRACLVLDEAAGFVGVLR
jgi:hypothetical protein